MERSTALYTVVLGISNGCSSHVTKVLCNTLIYNHGIICNDRIRDKTLIDGSKKKGQLFCRHVNRTHLGNILYLKDPYIDLKPARTAPKFAVERNGMGRGGSFQGERLVIWVGAGEGK